MDMKAQRFGIEVELTGITRKEAADIAAAYFGTSSRYLGAGYDTYAALDNQGRQWKFMSDASITPQRKNGRQTISASDEYKTEMVSPICYWDDIEKVQELVRKLREAGAISSSFSFFCRIRSFCCSACAGSRQAMQPGSALSKCSRAVLNSSPISPKRSSHVRKVYFSLVV